MLIIPGINCEDFTCVKESFAKAKEILDACGSGNKWVHIDVADGAMTHGHKTWQRAFDMKDLDTGDVNVELHLMVNRPEDEAAEWLQTGISRLIFHLEMTGNVDVIVKMCQEKGIDPMLALGPGTTASHAMQYLEKVNSCQLLAVSPGPSGQKFQSATIEKIKEIRKAFPDMIIEVDGGIDPETGRACYEAGASQLSATSYIFNDPNPIAAFVKLQSVGIETL